MNKKISDLAAATDLSGPELFEVLQGGVNKKVPATGLLSLSGLEVSTASGTITLPFGGGGAAYSREFYASPSFATPKTIALSGDTNANHFVFIFEITDVAATLTFPSGFKSGDTRFNIPSALIWTSNETGIFKITGDKYGSNWIIEFTLFPAV